MDISIIICTFNRCESLARTLGSIYAMQVPDSIRWELLVVDNNSRDGTRDTVEGFRSRQNTDTSPIYLLEKRQGHTHARNRGIREAQGNVIAFTDDDVEVDTNWLTQIWREFSRNDAACVGGKILPIWEGAKPDWLGEDLYHYIALLDLGDERIRLSSPTLWGANLSYKAGIFKKYGLFDTSIGHTGGKLYGGDEVELNQNLLKAGERIVYCPDILVWHHISRSRMERSYFRKWSFDKGELKGIQQGDYPYRNFYGIPLYMIRQLPGEILRSWIRQLRNPESRLREQMNLAGRIGYLSGRLKYNRALNRS
jgi:glycosyltransferase involved in cell wall biosynthesis